MGLNVFTIWSVNISEGDGRFTAVYMSCKYEKLIHDNTPQMWR